MERLEFDYPSANRPVSKKAHVGVVGSGDMEVLMQPAEKGIAHKHNGAVRIHINDAGATPGSVMLRLEQAMEVIDQ
jgi:malonate decarboxylase delta subunit